MKKIFLTIALTFGLMASSQVKIGTNPTNINAASLLEIESTTQGVLFPRVALSSTTTATLAGGAHVAGMTVYNTATAGDVTPGMYTNDGVKWVKLSNNAEAPLNVTAEQTGDYTALATDDIILINYNTGGLRLTLPTSGILIGKKYYISNMGNSDCGFTNILRGSAVAVIPGQMSGIVMYIGLNDSTNVWTIVSTQ